MEVVCKEFIEINVITMGNANKNITEINDCENVNWSYNHKKKEGPNNWQDLCSAFSNCGGNRQSPININTNNVVHGENLISPKFYYNKTKVSIINNAHTVQFNVNGNNKVNFNGKDYKLLQFHYHALSEHTINNRHNPLEVHFVHKYNDIDYAVLGIMFIEGKENELFKKYLDEFPIESGEYDSDEMIELLSLLPNNKSYYLYDGSLTTPPCTEIVSWYILKNPLEASKEQIKEFSKILNKNYRKVLPLNGRTIKLYYEE